MSLIEDLNEAKKTQAGGVRCRLCVAMDDMPDEDREAFDEAMSTQSLSKAKGTAVLKANGYDVGLRSVEGHYRSGHHKR